MKKTWTAYHMFQLHMLYPFCCKEDVAWAMGKSASVVKAAASRYGIKKEVKFYGHPSTSTPKIDSYLREHYLSVPVKRLAILVKKSHTFVKTRLRQLGLVIPSEIIAQRKADSRIKPGTPPPNKGKKMPAHVRAKVAHTFFKKGQRVHNEAINGEIRIRHYHIERRERAYQWIRIKKSKWEMLHVHLWKKHNGKIPTGKIVVFKDGNPMNCELSNLTLITREENMMRNTIHRFPEELISAIRITARLTKKLKTLKHEKQTA